MKTIKIYLFIFIALLIAMLINDFTKPKPIDWTPSFLSSRKAPYGAYILHKELNNFFQKSKITNIRVTPYEYISAHYDVLDNEDESKNRLTYFFLNNYINMDEESSTDLLSFVEIGNTVFMAGDNFPTMLADSLHFKTENQFSTSTEEIILKLANKKISRTKYNYKKAVGNSSFKELDSTNATVLGYNQEFGLDTEHINFVKIKYGKGNFILNTQPYAFTNYHMLESNHAVYVADCFSYLPDNDILWDERNKAQNDEIKSKLRFILSKPALKYGWFTALGALLLFMIFRAKRRQRIIPIIDKLPNTSIDFAKTIGNLYYQDGKPEDIINKKITFFLEHLRNKYLLDTQNLNTDFKKHLYHKTGVPQEEINRLIDYIYNLSNTNEPKETSLLILNKLIDKFYKQTQLKKD